MRRKIAWGLVVVLMISLLTIFVSAESVQCDNGCRDNGDCVAYGELLPGAEDLGFYCSVTGKFKPPKIDFAFCEQDYECASKVCMSNTCSPSGEESKQGFFSNFFSGFLNTLF